MSVLTITNLHASVEGKEILKGVNLKINEGETVALLGPNGHGKSTLFNVIMGHPKYQVTEGSIYFDDQDVLALSTDERSKLGLFLGMQLPSEIPGVINSDFLKAAVNARREKPISTYNFYKLLDQATKELKMPFDLATRSLNEGFSGGEKKRNEILQLELLEPKIALLDEIDSGLDVDAMQVVADVIKKEQANGRGFLIISHYARLYDLVKPTRAVVMINGRIVLDGGPEIFKRIDQTGYEFIKTEYGVEIEKEDQDMNKVSIGSCAVKEAIKQMERIRINKENNKLKSGEYIIESFDNLVIETEVNSTIDILLSKVPENSSLKMTISEGSNVTFSILAETVVKSANIDVYVKKDGVMYGYFADFSQDEINLKCVINLEEEGASTYFKLASLAANQDIKNIDVSVKHISAKTYGKVDNYGVCKDEAKMTFLGTSHILKDSIKSKTQQNAKIMVFDEASTAIAKPILKIDENDIEASHAAVVGKINDEHLFYMTSRGISESEAKQLITFGYLKPIISGFKEEAVKEHISSLIEGRM